MSAQTGLVPSQVAIESFQRNPFLAYLPHTPKVPQTSLPSLFSLNLEVSFCFPQDLTFHVVPTSAYPMHAHIVSLRN